MNLRERQIQKIVDFIKAGEKPVEDFKIGAEFEHFVIDKETMRTVSFTGEDGVESLMRTLVERNDWTPHPEGDSLLTITKNDMTITTEPGAQLEFSMQPKVKIAEMDEVYHRFIDEVVPILEERGQEAISVGYHPKTKIEEITLLPKERYHNMFNYFKTRGSRSHNMMKGTCALQIAIDFSHEEDYRKKFYVANMLSNVFYSIYENAYYFEGEPCDMHNIRAYIWEKTDNDRSGLVAGSLDANFSYRKYAKYLLDRPAIYAYVDGELTYTADTPIKELLDPDTIKREELEHLFTMFFPDVRTKTFVEIRMFDAIPYPLNFSAIALLKGLFYDEENLEALYKRCQSLDIDRVMETRQELYEKGLQAHQCDNTMLETGRELVRMARKGLPEEEQKYLDVLEEMLDEGTNLYEITRENHDKGRRVALDPYILRRGDKI